MKNRKTITIIIYVAILALAFSWMLGLFDTGKDDLPYSQLVSLIENGQDTDKFIIAVDSVGAGIGETVLLTTGSSARLALQNTNAPVDAVVVGIVD